MDEECDKCGDQNYIVGGCCNGHMCGCMGQAVTITNCKRCNPSNDKEMGEELKQFRDLKYLEWID